ncbi:MAG: CBS domain-containing protein [Sulfolobaceae archaeon]|nr:CBS domain-containing protein [Sulfolobaceae archaeon]
MQNLSLTQREILLALIELYGRLKRMVKSKEIADMINKDEGTVRNIILSLKVLGLVDSKPGPNGGYIPTLKAYEIVKTHTTVPVMDKLSLIKGNVETDIMVDNIELLDITNPSGNKVLLKVSGDLKKLKIGDSVRLGPTPYTRLVIEGVVIHIDDSRKELILDVKRMASIPREKVKNLISRSLIFLKPDLSLKEASSIFYKEGIRGAPVIDENGKLLGILTSADIMRALAEGKTEAKVVDYMRVNVITINEDDDLLDAIKKMFMYNVGRLLITNIEGKVVGILTRTDILKSIAGLGGVLIG